MVGGTKPDTQTGLQPYKSTVSPLGMFASLATIPSHLREANRLEGQKYTPEGMDYNAVRPRMIDLSRERETINRNADLSGAILNKQAGQAGSQAATQAQQLAGITGTQRVQGQQLGQSYQTEEVANQQAKQRADEINSQGRFRTDLSNIQERVRAQMMNNQLDTQASGVRLGVLNTAAGAFTGYLGNVSSASQYDNMLAMMASQGNYGNYIDPSYYKLPAWKRTLMKAGNVQPGATQRIRKTDPLSLGGN